MFLAKIQKKYAKIPDAVCKRGNDTYLWKKGNNKRENTGKAAGSSEKVFLILQKKRMRVWLEGSRIRTDLALEATERFREEKVEVTWSRDQGKNTMRKRRCVLQL